MKIPSQSFIFSLQRKKNVCLNLDYVSNIKTNEQV